MKKISSFEKIIGEQLMKSGKHIATAESCTGGYIGHLLTNIPGSSAYYKGGVVTYSNEAKAKLLGVQQSTLDTFGAVSEQTALEMAQGVRLLLNTDLGISVTGIAGPGGETPGKPVGLTWIGISSPTYDKAISFIWPYDRIGNKIASGQKALEMAVQYLKTGSATG